MNIGKFFFFTGNGWCGEKEAGGIEERRRAWMGTKEGSFRSRSAASQWRKSKQTSYSMRDLERAFPSHVLFYQLLLYMKGYKSVRPYIYIYIYIFVSLFFLFFLGL